MVHVKKKKKKRLVWDSPLKGFREKWGILHMGRMGSERSCQLHFQGMTRLESPSWN